MAKLSEKNLKRIREIEFAINRNLFLICAVITLTTMIIASIEFFGRGAFPSSRISFFYVGILVIYSVHKELLRWLEEKKIERQGEWFVYSWIGLTLVFYIVNFLTKDYFDSSSEGLPLGSLTNITVLTLQVCIIFLLTKLSKVVKISLEKNE
ncbi:hypothetical protein ACFL0A_02395 [Patescibacteria group bacterium]